MMRPVSSPAVHCRKDFDGRAVRWPGEVRVGTMTAALRQDRLAQALKRGILGSWHKVSVKHLPAYLDEMTCRFNNRKNPYLFRDTLLKLLEAEKLPYRALVDRAAS